MWFPLTIMLVKCFSRIGKWLPLMEYLKKTLSVQNKIKRIGKNANYISNKNSSTDFHGRPFVTINTMWQHFAANKMTNNLWRIQFCDALNSGQLGVILNHADFAGFKMSETVFDYTYLHLLNVLAMLNCVALPPIELYSRSTNIQADRHEKR